MATKQITGGTDPFGSYLPYSEQPAPVTSGVNHTTEVLNNTKKYDPLAPNTTYSVSKVIFPRNEPKLGDAPEYTLPEYNEKEVASISRRVASPYIRNLRQAAEIALSRRSSNPNENRLTLREALGAYGQGLESIMSSASSQAVNEYNAKRREEIQASQLNYSAQLEKWRTSYQAAWQKYMASATKVTQTRNVYEKDSKDSLLGKSLGV